MNGYERYAIYYMPEAGPLADFTARWLGWDAQAGHEAARPAFGPLPAPIEAITESPHKYGFHGTIKPPMRLAKGRDGAGLHAAMGALATRLPAVTLEGLELARLGGFLALVPRGETGALARLAASVVTGLDDFRAPAPPEELSRRRAAGLSPRQEAHLLEWGYPYVMEDFKFHLTLTGKLPADQAELVEAALRPQIAPLLPAPLAINSLCLCGQAADGRFHLLHRYTLTGASAARKSATA